MDSVIVDKELTKLQENYLKEFKKSDEETIYYFIKIIEALYKELSYEVYDKDKLYDIVCNNFKNSIGIVFNNMKDYHLKKANNLSNDFSKIAKVSICSAYISYNNLFNIYNNFRLQVSTDLNLENKVKVLVNSNGNLLLEQIHSSCVVTDSKKVTTIVQKNINLIIDEMIKNIAMKNEFLLSIYKNFINESSEDATNNQDRINEINIKIIVNTTYTYLKEQEYFVIEKYTKNNIKEINNYFKNIEAKAKELGAKKNKSNKLSTVKDYFLGFNNTIRIKTKNIFDEMNLVVTQDSDTVNTKIKEFSNLISQVYSLNIKFDKQFNNYRKEFSIPSHNREKFKEYFDKASDDLRGQIKLSISNIFRENTSFYNNVVYKSVVLKSRLNEFNEVLTEKKVKDLLVK